MSSEPASAHVIGATDAPAAIDDADDIEGPDPTATSTTASSLTAAPTTSTKPEPPARPFEMNLYHANDWVPQYTLTWCVGASIQMMVNVAEAGQNRTKSTQAAYMLKAQGGEQLSSRGAGAWGWAEALTELGIGAYQVSWSFTFDDALRIAARAMRDTRLPVGLLVWGGSTPG